MDLPLRQSLLLGTYLAHRDDWVGRDELLTLFWPDEAESTARHNLSQLVYHCRRQPWFEGLEVERTRLRWQVVSDLQRFRAAIGAGAWSDALASYGGPLLDGLPAGAAPPFEAWLDGERETLQAAWRGATLQVAAALESEGRAAEATARLQAVIERDPLAEDALQAYLRCAASAGQRAAALRAFDTFRTALRDELDLAPLEATSVLAEALRSVRDADGSTDATRAAPGTAPPAPGTGAHLGIEPIPTPIVLRGFAAPITPFVGRAAELEAVDELLTERGERLVTLVGPGGVGKTRLAIEAGRRAARAFTDGAVFVPLADVDDPTYLARAIGDALALEPATDESDEEALMGALASRSLLLVLDNLEHLLDGAGLVAEVLAASPGSSALVTSQAPLGFQGEVQFEVAGMRYPKAPDVPLEGFDAVALFLRSARRTDPRFTFDRADAEGIVRLCVLLEGLPLGLELAAAWVHLLRPAEVADALASSLEALAADRSDVPARHRSLRAMLDHAWSLLGDDERAALAAVAVFHSGCTREAAEAVTGASLRTLLALVTKSLLRRTASGRFESLDVVRRYGLERLGEDPARRAAVLDAHAEHFTDLGLRVAPELVGSAPVDAANRLAAEHDNLRAALDHAVASGDAERGLRLANALFQYWWLRGHYREGRSRLDALLRLERPLPDDVYAEALGNAGSFAFLFDDLGAARPHYEASIAIARRSSDPVAPVATLTRLANLLTKLGDTDGAQHALEDALARVQAGDAGAKHAAQVLNHLAGLAKHRGDAESAERWNRACFQAAKDAGDEFMAASAQANLGESAMLRGDLDEARSLHTEARAIFERLDFRVGLAINAQHFGDVALAAGDLAAAGEDLELAMARFADLDDRLGVAEVAVSLVDLAVARADWPAALRWIGAVRAQHDRLGIALSVGVRKTLDGHEATAGAHLRPAEADAMLAEGASWTVGETVSRAAADEG